MTPVWPNLPGPETFLPVVAIVAVLLPAAMTWLFGSLTPGQAAWGLRGIDVLEGDFLLLRTTDSSTPPFFPWCLSVALIPEIGDPCWRLTLPSYLFWILSAVVIHRLVRLWHDETTALLTILALSVNPVVLKSIQQGLPATVALFWGSLAILAYVEHMKQNARVLSAWTFIGGISIGLMILTGGLYAVWIPIMVAVHIGYDRIQNARDRRAGFQQLMDDPTLRAGLIGMGIAILLSSPWLVSAQSSRGAVALLSTAALTGETYRFEAPALVLPTMLALGLFGIARALRQRFRRQADKQASLPVLWSAVAYLVFLLLEPSSTGLIFVVVPLTVLAMRSLQLVVNRKLRDRTSFLLVLASVLVLMIAGTPRTAESLIEIVGQIAGGIFRGMSKASLRELGFPLLQVHLALDAVLLIGLAVAWFYRQPRHRDRNRRWLFGSFTVLVLGLAALIGLSSRADVRRGSDAWMELDRVMKGMPLGAWLCYLGEVAPSPELQFIARRHMLGKPRHRLVDVPELDALLDREPGQPLVVVSDPALNLPDSIPLTQRNETVTLGRQYSGEKARLYAPLGKGDGLSQRPKTGS